MSRASTNFVLQTAAESIEKFERECSPLRVSGGRQWGTRLRTNRPSNTTSLSWLVFFLDQQVVPPTLSHSS
jgi:hypothetical protein